MISETTTMQIGELAQLWQEEGRPVVEIMEKITPERMKVWVIEKQEIRTVSTLWLKPVTIIPQEGGVGATIKK